MTDRRTRPWRKLRVVVEVSVPPNNRSSSRDLIYHLRDQMPDMIALPRPIHNNAHFAKLHYKTFSSFLPAYLRAERGLKPRTKKKDDHNG